MYMSTTSESPKRAPGRLGCSAGTASRAAENGSCCERLRDMANRPYIENDAINEGLAQLNQDRVNRDETLVHACYGGDGGFQGNMYEYQASLSLSARNPVVMVLVNRLNQTLRLALDSSALTRAGWFAINGKLVAITRRAPEVAEKSDRGNCARGHRAICLTCIRKYYHAGSALFYDFSTFFGISSEDVVIVQRFNTIQPACGSHPRSPAE